MVLSWGTTCIYCMLYCLPSCSMNKKLEPRQSAEALKLEGRQCASRTIVKTRCGSGGTSHIRWSSSHHQVMRPSICAGLAKVFRSSEYQPSSVQGPLACEHPLLHAALLPYTMHDVQLGCMGENLPLRLFGFMV